MIVKNVIHRRTFRITIAFVLFGLFVCTPREVATAASKANDEIKIILAEAVPEIQKTMSSISQGCKGGPSGQPPQNWQGRQVPGNKAVELLASARTEIAESKNKTAREHINAGLAEWDKLIDSLHQSCPGGPHGFDPVNYGLYVAYRNYLKTQLQTALRFLED